MALGGVSIIVAAKIPPVAILSADSLEARIFDGDSNPAVINFDASASYDQDGGNLEFAFDLNADGALGAYNSNPQRSGNFSEKGVYYVGLSVHDVGDWSAPFEEGMVLAIEPILDMPDEKMHIRIEDTVLVTATGVEVLTAAVPKEIDPLLALVKR